jgi:hypothetical protein
MTYKLHSMNKMKSIAILSLVVIVAITTQGNQTGAPTGHAGAPKEGKHECSHCHTGGSPTAKTGWITSNIEANGYTPGKVYTIKAKVTYTGRIKFGFEATPQKANGTISGELIVSDAVETKMAGTGYITHTAKGTTGTDQKEWTFQWKAPAKGMGPAAIYGAFNASNNNQATSGDIIFTSKLAVNESTSVGIDENNFNSYIDIYPNPLKDILNIQYSLNTTSKVDIELLDVQGRVIENLLSETKIAGTHKATFNINTKYPAGLYFVNIKSEKNSLYKKIILQ